MNQNFARPGLSFETGNGGLTRAVISTPLANGEIYLQGAHVAAWNPVGEEPVLWLSKQSHFSPGKPIRGGVPICFPWFGPNAEDATQPAHGFARLIEWQVIATRTKADGITEIELGTTIGTFKLTYGVEFGSVLKMTLRTEVSTQSTEDQVFEDALHTYLAVSDVRSVLIKGLEAASYIDKVDQALLRPPSGSPIHFSGETDRIYLETISDCVLVDSGIQRSIRISKSGSMSTVIWNPWIEKSKRMPDFGDDEWAQMACVETTNVAGNRIKLLPGESHSTTATISVVT